MQNDQVRTVDKVGQYIYEDSPLKSIKDQDVIVCIDPGPRNMGYCVYSLKKDKILELNVVELRDPVSEDISEMKRIALSIKGVRKFVIENFETWATQNAYFYIEDQIEGRRKGMYEPNSIQDALHTLIGPDRVAIQMPHAVKAYFSDYYKMRDDAKNKYDSNKKNAEEYFMKLLPPKWLECVNTLKKYRKKKLDDVADAFFMAQLVACIYRGEPSHSTLRNLEEKRKKKEARELKKAEVMEKKREEKQKKMQEKERKKREMIPKNKRRTRMKIEAEAREKDDDDETEELPSLDKLLNE